MILFPWLANLVTVLLFCLPLISLQSQDTYCYDHITSEDGLSQSTVNCILQDRDGFIWIGTQNGLNKYDGYHFTYYQNQPSDSTSLSDNYILSICEDNEGYLWVGTMSGGLNRLDKQTGRFTSFINSPADTNSISNNTIWAVSVDKYGKIWAGSNNGISLFDPTDQIFNYYRFSESDTNTISSDMVLSFFKDNMGSMWIGTLKGICRFNEESGNFHRITNNIKDEKINELAIWTINQNADGNIILGTNKGLWELNLKTEKFHKLSDKKKYQPETVWSVLPIKNGNILFGTRKGLMLLQYPSLICKSINCDPSNTETGSNNNVWCIFKDNSGIIWTGTDKGIIKIDSKGKKFRVFNAKPGKKMALSSNNVNAILIDHLNTLWIGTEGGGLNRLDKEKNRFIVYKTNNFIQNSLSNNNVWSLLEDKDGVIYAGTYGGGLNAFDRKSETFKVYKENKKDPESLSNNRILTMLEDKEGIIWIGTRGGGLNRFDKKTEKFEAFIPDPKNEKSISSYIIISLAEDNYGNLWVGTFEGGISIYDKKNKIFKTYKNEPDEPGSISNNNIWSIFFDSKKRMWLGTQGGLNVALHPNEDMTFMRFTSEQGLSSNAIFGITEDNNGNIWMSTFRGISMLNIQAFEELLVNEDKPDKFDCDPFNPLFNIYDSGDGLQSNEFNQGAYYKSKDGTIYFGGSKGVNYFNPDSLKESTYNPPVIITDFKIFNKSVGVVPDGFKGDVSKNKIITIDNDYFLSKKISYLDKIELTYRESVFSFEFSSLDYTLSKKNQYAYLMEGFNKDWNYVAGKNSATYTNLDAGKYVFRVKATNSDGKWSNNEARLEITIIPPFWKTTWFIIIVIIISVIVLFVSVSRIIHNQKKKAIIEKERIELQLKTIKNQIDPHFAFNAMTMIGSLVYKNDPDAVYDYFTRFAGLIRSTLQDSEKISRPLRDEMEFVKNYIAIQKTRFKDKFDFILKIDEGIDMGIEVPKMIIQTHTENAIKHGLMHKKTKGKLMINLEQKNDQLIISVEDNGVGRIKASELNKNSTKKGMQIIEQIFSLYYKLTKHKIEQEIIDLKDENGNAAGTKVVVAINKVGSNYQLEI
ncbi:MAG: histidine kinase [Bacteroidales bacterium]|nr:histidine kinase [Bacteroidales bacterium]